MIKNIITTDSADLIAYHSARTGQAPALYFDTLTRRVVADISLESREAFYSDSALQRYLSVKLSIWRAISALKEARR